VAKASGRAVGATAYWDPRLWPAGDGLCAIEVGFTWLAASAQGTGHNVESKLLMFRHAFEVWGVDSAMYSILAAEWPGRRSRLEARLAAWRSPADGALGGGDQ
jgi:hypothetical protein